MKLAYILILFLLIPFATAKEGHIVLLAISEQGGQEVGSTADVYLKVEPGSGHVYMDTFPLTRLDTQISIRFAQEIACDYLDKDCSDYDFFYTIRSDSVIIGGPSAGAALTILTASVLEGWSLDDKITITGTINPGGFIGTVGGIDQKVKAAAKAGINKVIIPKGSAEEGNLTVLNLTAEENGLAIIEITTLEEAIYEFTGKEIASPDFQITVNPGYTETMKDIAQGLCQRQEDLSIELDDVPQEVQNLTDRSNDAFSSGSYYSAASYCFGANIQLRNLIYEKANLTEEEIGEKSTAILDEIRKMQIEFHAKSTQTIQDLQARIIVKERLLEAMHSIEDIQLNETTAIYSLAYSEERLYSARMWAKFFSNEGQAFEINQETLKNSCMQKLSEAEERYQYAKLYIPILAETRKGLDEAYGFQATSDYDMCLFMASKSKAEANLMLSSTGITPQTIDDYMDIKLRLIEKTIYTQQAENIFPILGYSYYEYGKSLRESDKYSALLYAEYALELSNLDLYFKSQQHKPSIAFNFGRSLLFFLGAAFGVGVTMAFLADFLKKDDNSIRIKIKKR